MAVVFLLFLQNPTTVMWGPAKEVGQRKEVNQHKVPKQRGRFKKRLGKRGFKLLCEVESILQGTFLISPFLIYFSPRFSVRHRRPTSSRISPAVLNVIVSPAPSQDSKSEMRWRFDSRPPLGDCRQVVIFSIRLLQIIADAVLLYALWREGKVLVLNE